MVYLKNSIIFDKEINTKAGGNSYNTAKKVMLLNPYKIKWALFVDENNITDFGKSIHAPNQESLLEKLKGKAGRFFIITDKQFGLIQNSWSDKPLQPNTKLSVHLNVTNRNGCKSLVPLTKKQFENPIIL